MPMPPPLPNAAMNVPMRGAVGAIPTRFFPKIVNTAVIITPTNLIAVTAIGGEAAHKRATTKNATAPAMTSHPP